MNLLLNRKCVFAICYPVVLVMTACHNKESEDATSNVAIAQVDQKVLSLKELEEMYPDHLNSADSILIAHALADRWIRKEVFLSEAERSLVDMKQLNEMVNDYRESLIIHGYEEKLLNNFSDTVVTDQEIQTFFDQNPDQFKLKKAIVKYNLAIFPRKSVEEEYQEIKKLWDRMDSQRSMNINLIKYLDLYAEAFVLDTMWHAMDDLLVMIPESVSEDLLNKSHRLELEDENHFYFLRIIDIAEKTDEAPLTYIRNFANKAILQKRRMQWLEKIKADLYQEALRDKRIIKYEN